MKKAENKRKIYDSQASRKFQKKDYKYKFKYKKSKLVMRIPWTMLKTVEETVLMKGKQNKTVKHC